jgi:hypothetical protein
LLVQSFAGCGAVCEKQCVLDKYRQASRAGPDDERPSLRRFGKEILKS